MKSADFSLLAPLLLAAAVTPALAQQPNSGVDRLYVLKCGHGTAPDQGRFSPGYNDGTTTAILSTMLEAISCGAQGLLTTSSRGPVACLSWAADQTGCAAIHWPVSSNSYT